MPYFETIESIALNPELSDIERCAAFCINETRRMDERINADAAGRALRVDYPNLTMRIADKHILEIIDQGMEIELV